MKYIKFKVNKLIRDNIKQKLAAEGVIVQQRVMDTDEYQQELNRKLIEEATECIDSKTTQELAEEIGDVLEVLYAIAASNNIDLKTIDEARLKKLQKNGGFEQKIYCTYIEVEESSPKRAYYEARPNQYPLLNN